MASSALLRPTPGVLSRVVLLATVLLIGSVLSPPPAAASITYLCTGYKACRDAGMGNAGYAKNRSTMYWRMYAGHNCTNYAAYRMVRSGMPNTRPWEGSGNASNWGYAMDHITDATPMVGAIAWWRANAPGAGSSGHVAYVERVEAPGVIVVSQDNWGGDFKWSRVTTSGTGWPTGFIHFNDVPMLNTVAPAVEGTPRVGATLTADGGAWKPRNPSLTYQWRRNGRVIDGATAASYTVRQGDLDDRIAVAVTASRLGYPTTRVRSAAVTIVPGELGATQQPTVTGEARVDAPLSAQAPTWNLTPDEQSYQWLAAGTPVPGATATTFTPGPDQLGQRIRVRVTATRAGYEPTTVTSTATEPVVEGSLTQVRQPSIAGAAVLGEVLTLDPGESSPATTPAITWLRGSTPIDGATGTTYTLTEQDLGARISAAVTRSRPGYTPWSAQAGQTLSVKSPARLRLRHATPGGGRVRLVAIVTAPAVTPVTGTVRFAAGRRFVTHAELVEGRAVVRLRGVPAGPRKVRVGYGGATLVTTARLVRDIVVQ